MIAADAIQTPPWQPIIPLHRASPEKIAKASKLQAVLMPFLQSCHDERFSQAEWEQSAIARYRGIFGREISGRQIRYLFKRTMDRDRRAGNWPRLEIFLDDDIGRAAHRRPEPSFDHSELAVRIRFKNADKPTPIERQNVMELSFRHFSELAAQCPGRRREIKKSLLRYLRFNAAGLAKSPKALKRNWERKFAEWTDGGCVPSAIQDHRAARSGNFNLLDLEADLKLIVNEAWHHDGKISLAYRKLRRAGKLSKAFMDRYTLNVRSDKSYVAKSIRAEINRYLTGTLEHRRGPRAVRDASPHIARSHDHYNPGDYSAADDVKFNSYFWYIGPDGRPAVTCGECLVWFDCRSLYPLGYIHTPGHYNGETIRRGMLHIHDRHGLPHKGFIYERGIWESRLILGERRNGFLGWDEYEMNLRERGLAIEIQNVTTPGAKLIELVFNLLQQDMRNLPGFVGFNERSYNQEKMQKLIGQVRRGAVDPRGKFLSQEQICRAFDAAFESYMHEPQNGELLKGLSPAEMYAGHKPLRKLSDDQRFLLASHRQRVKVECDGINLTIRGKKRGFHSAELARLYLGSYVHAWYNVETPDLLTVTDLDMKNPITIRREVIPAFNASKEELSGAHRARNGFMKEARLRVDNIRHPVRNSITDDTVLDSDARAVGLHIRRQTEQFRIEENEHARLEGRARRAAEDIGLPAPEEMRNPARFERGAEIWKEAAQDEAAEGAAGPSAAHKSPVKEYVLDSNPSASAPKPTANLYWLLWTRVEKIKPGLSRHALTRRALQCHGPNPSPHEMTPAQLAKMIDVFSAILRDAKKPAYD
ncbi:MAG TPA: hypothetical protein VGO59_18015 [Verrucomicrobiae bacterium]|jgi:hypothetical protein